METKYTNDSRHLLSKLKTAKRCYFIYSENLNAESDGIAYNEILFLRSILLHPIALGIAHLAFFSSMIHNPRSPQHHGRENVKFGNIHPQLFLVHVIAFILHFLRIFISTLILVLEILLWLPRVILGTIFTPFGFKISVGQIYALPCSFWDRLLGRIGLSVYKTVLVRSNPSCSMSGSSEKAVPRNIFGGFWSMQAYKHKSFIEANYNAMCHRLKQRGGRKPEIIFLFGQHVLISNWSPITIDALMELLFDIFNRKQVLRCSWEVLDVHALYWTRTVIIFEDEWNKTIFEELLKDEENIAEIFPEVQKVTNDNVSEVGNGTVFLWRHLKTFSNIRELEDLFYSPLGFNKYHHMEAYENMIKVHRPDRRWNAHLLALVSSFLLLCFFQYQSSASSETEFSFFSLDTLSVDVIGLLIANYVFISAFAAEALTGKVEDIVDARNERYGLIVSKALNGGFVRGFHVVDEKGESYDWMFYENEDRQRASAIHQTSTDEVQLMNVIFNIEGDGAL